MPVRTTRRLLGIATLVAAPAALGPGPVSAQGVRPDVPPVGDPFGYVVFGPGAPECAFDFVDIEGSGEIVALTAGGAAPADDDGGALLTLALPFELYGEPVGSFVVSSNGYLAAASSLAEEDGGDFSNDASLPAIPNNDAGVPLRVMVYHDDLSGMDGGGAVHHEHFSVCPRPSEAMGEEACSVVQWTDWGFAGGSGSFDLQAITYHGSFEIVAQIRPGQAAPDGGTIGIQNRRATAASQYRPVAALSTETAICFFEPRYPPGGPLADLEITKHDKVDVDVEEPPWSIGYAIGVLNRGPSPVAGAVVEDVIPPSLVDCEWTCTVSAGSTCGPAGSGDLDEAVDLAPDGWVDFVLLCDLAGIADAVVNTASVSVPSGVSDPWSANDSATEIVAVAAGRVPDGAELPGTDVLRVARLGGQLVLSWGPSCLASDADYEIYEGSFDDFVHYWPIACDTGGARTYFHDLPGGNAYYLVVPTNFRFEGSYGVVEAGVERPVGDPVCLPQAIGACP
jgi:uncharacterized repeat protein (TIGR01451 family)